MIDTYRLIPALTGVPSVTRSEAFGLALLEGMAAGCVPVASHLPGVADVVGNEGFTFPSGDDAALREILRRLQNEKALRLHHADLAQARARLYPWERVVFGYERIFDRLTGLAPERQRLNATSGVNGQGSAKGARIPAGQSYYKVQA